MNGYLLDTHILVWWWTDASRLSPAAYHAIHQSGQNIYVSAVSIWEMAIKYHKGKFSEAEPIIRHLEYLMTKSQFLHLDMNHQHGLLAGKLPQVHGDPFDRMLVAQAISENLTLISKDEKLQQFELKLLW